MVVGRCKAEVIDGLIDFGSEIWTAVCTKQQETKRTDGGMDGSMDDGDDAEPHPAKPTPKPNTRAVRGNATQGRAEIPK